MASSAKRMPAMVMAIPTAISTRRCSGFYVYTSRGMRIALFENPIPRSRGARAPRPLFSAPPPKTAPLASAPANRTSSLCPSARRRRLRPRRARSPRIERRAGTARATGADDAARRPYPPTEASSSLVTALTIGVGYAVGGNVIIETVFSWPGVGRLLVRAVQQHDYPLAQGAFLLIAFVIISMNFLAVACLLAGGSYRTTETPLIAFIKTATIEKLQASVMFTSGRGRRSMA